MKYGLDTICFQDHNWIIQWEVRLADEFDAEFDRLPEVVQDELLAKAKLLEMFGPGLGRPHVDTGG